MFGRAAKSWFATGLILSAGCNVAPPKPEPAPPDPSAPAPLTGTVTLPGMSALGLSARIGIGPARVIVNSAFGGSIHKDAPAILQISNASGSPILIAIRPPDIGSPIGEAAPESIEVSPRSTAVALVYLTPFITPDNATYQRAALNLISSLPEIDALANSISRSLSGGVNVDLLADAAVREALGRAIQAFLNRVNKPIPPKRVIVRPGEASHVAVSVIAGQSGSYLVTNSGGRTVSVRMTSSSTSVLIPARRALIDLGPVLDYPAPAPAAARLVSSLAETKGDVVAAFGLGIGGGLPDPAAFDDWGTPTALDLLNNVAKPLLQNALNVPLITDDILKSLENSLTDRDLLASFLANMQYRRAGEALLAHAARLSATVTQDQSALLHRMLDRYLESPADFPEIAAAAPTLLAFPAQIAQAVNDRVDFASALAEFSTAKWKEEFLLAPFPTAEDVLADVPFGTATRINLSPGDAPGFRVAAQPTSSPLYGSLSAGASPTEVVYTPISGFAGPDTFTYVLHVNDTEVTNQAFVRITVQPRNNLPPFAFDDNILVTKDSPGPCMMLRATDPDSPNLLYKMVTWPAHGTINDPAHAGPFVVYKPDAGFIGDDSFSFWASDGKVNSNVATVTLKVRDATASVALLGASGSFASSNGAFAVAILPMDGNSNFIGDTIPAGAYCIRDLVVLPLGAGSPASPGVSIVDVRVRPPLTGPLTAVVDFDCSGSMSSNDPGAVGRTAGGNAFFDSLSPGDTVAVLDFGNGVTPPLTNSRLLQDFTTDVSLMRAALGGLTASNGTPLYESLLDALGLLSSHLNGPGGVIVIVTDGQAGTSREADVLSAAVAQEVPIYTIGLGSGVNADQLLELATQTGGAYAQADDAAGLQSVFSSIGLRIRGGVTVYAETGYVPPVAGHYTVQGLLVIANTESAVFPTTPFSFTATVP